MATPGIDFDKAYTRWTPEEIKSSIRSKCFYISLAKREGKAWWVEQRTKERLELEAALEWHTAK
jgi:hypothetical protein